MIPLLSEKRAGIEALCRRYGVLRLEVFGSAAVSESDSEARDVDFLVEFEEGRGLGPWMRDYFDLRDALSGLLARDVDLVMVGAMKNRWFIREVNRTRKVLYAA